MATHSYPMTLEEYQAFVAGSAVFPKKLGIIYCALKLAGEAGEIAEKIGKLIRDNGAYDEATGMLTITEEQRQLLLKEIGDVEWYTTALSAELGSSKSEVLRINVAKLTDRRNRGVLKGSGDER